MVMRVSIITVCYNRASTIDQSIRSVFKQDYPDIEYIIVDGNSSDGTQNVIERAIKGAPRNFVVKYVSERDSGMYEALNKGVAMATGEVVALCHSDDTIFDNHVVADYVKCFEETGADMVYADGLFVDADDPSKVIRHWIGGNYSKWKVRHGWLPLHPTCYIKRDFMQKAGLYDTKYKIAADSELLVRYLKMDTIKVSYMKRRNTVLMRMGGLSTDNTKRKMMWDEDIDLYTRHGFKLPTLMKMEKIMWKIPQFILGLFNA